jgi:predicted metal-dependent hydrolase
LPGTDGPPKRRRSTGPVTTEHSRIPLAPDDRGLIEHLDVEIRRSRRRRKTIELRVEGAAVIVAAPARASDGEIAEVVRKRAAWILRHRNAATATAPRRFEEGDAIPYLGRDLPITLAPAAVRRPTVRLRGDTFEVGLPASAQAAEQRDAIEAAFERWYREAAATHLSGRVAHWAAVSGRHPSAILVRNQRRRWASCAPDGTLRFNWRLLLAPPDLIDYVVVHELAHLAVPNHSPAFWTEVARVMPDHRDRRRRLQALGPQLTL